MPIPSQTGIPYNKLATKSMVMDMRHKCNYKIRKKQNIKGNHPCIRMEHRFSKPHIPDCR